MMSDESVYEVVQLPKKAQWLADRFAENANWGGLHAYDWIRFYEFVVHCSRHCQRLRYHHIVEHFEARGMPRRLASRLGEVFHHGTRMLWIARYSGPPASPWVEQARNERRAFHRES